MAFAPLHRYASLVTLATLGALGTISLANRAPAAPAQKGAAAKGSRPGAKAADPVFVQHEIVLRLAKGADAEGVGRDLGFSLVKKLKYAPNTAIFNVQLFPIDLALQRAQQHPSVLLAAKHQLGNFFALPKISSNDELVSDQWPLRVLNGPNFWNIAVGERFINGPQRNAVVAVIDMGPQTSHPDLAANIDPRGFDFINGQPYDESSVLIGLEGHGTEMAGCVAAVTNNSEGISSLPWEGVSVLPCHIGREVVTNNVISIVPDFAAAADALYYCIEQGVDVVNMSFGSFFTDPILAQAVIDAYNEGIILVGASGNSRFFGTSLGVSFPASMDEVIAVGAVGPSGELAFYSDGGPELDLVAPGGNDSTDADSSRQCLVTDSSFGSGFLVPAGYNYSQGTSQASAYTSGVIATLITQGALDETLPLTDQVESIRSLLIRTARNPFGQRTDDFGFGLINAESALRSITQVIDFTSPEPNEVTASYAEPLIARITQPIPTTLDTSDFQIFQNNVDVTPLAKILGPATGDFEYQPDAKHILNVGNNRFNVIADNALIPNAKRSLEGPATGLIPDRTFRIRVNPHREQPGLKMLSVPYQLLDDADSLEFLFGGNLVRLARWLPDQNRYAVFDLIGSPQDPAGSLLTGDSGVLKPPIGTGFFARVVSPTDAQLLGRAERNAIYEVPLKPGFNLIGDPFPFNVPWNTVNVRFGREILSLEEARDRRLMEDVLWRYDNGRYAAQVLPNGEFRAWESCWVRSYVNLTLLVPRVPSVIGGQAR